MPQPQNYKNHTRFDPPFHFVLIPILLLNLILSIYVTIKEWPNHPHAHPWWIVMSVAFLLMALKTRINALAVQNRVIRLEERIRLAALLPAAEVVRSHALTTQQLVALRFASDSELPMLVSRALAENLNPKQIKQAIVTWRPDEERV